MKGGASGSRVAASAQRGSTSAVGSSGGAPVALGAKKQRESNADCRASTGLRFGGLEGTLETEDCLSLSLWTSGRPPIRSTTSHHHRSELADVASDDVEYQALSGGRRVGADTLPAKQEGRRRLTHPVLMLSCRFESTQEAKARANAEGIVKAEDLVVALRTGRGMQAGHLTCARTSIGGRTLTSVLLSPHPPRLAPVHRSPDDKKIKYLVVEGPEALAKLGNRDEVWYV